MQLGFSRLRPISDTPLMVATATVIVEPERGAANATDGEAAGADGVFAPLQRVLPSGTCEGCVSADEPARAFGGCSRGWLGVRSRGSDGHVAWDADALAGVNGSRRAPLALFRVQHSADRQLGGALGVGEGEAAFRLSWCSWLAGIRPNMFGCCVLALWPEGQSRFPVQTGC